MNKENNNRERCLVVTMVISFLQFPETNYTLSRNTSHTTNEGLLMNTNNSDVD